VPELFLDAEGRLIPEQEWLSALEPLARVPLLAEQPKASIIRGLQELIVTSVTRRIPPNKNINVGVLFSGGVDSTLIALLLQKFNVTFTCITVGFQDGNAKEPEDVTESRRIAQEMGFEQVVVLLNLEQMHELFKKTVMILGPELTNVVNVGVGSVEIAGFEKGKELGITYFFGGLGSEELFAGYDRHEKALETGGFTALHDECIAGLKGMYRRDLLREAAIAKALDVGVATPFLDKDLLEFSLTIPPQYKINGSHTFVGRARGDVPMERTVKKLILREAAVALGLPEHASFRPKRAAQYGSRTNNALTSLAAKRGFAHKEEYLRSLLAKHYAFRR
jgi:asparagine synthetase B (glutamine-hydrolysing)